MGSVATTTTATGTRTIARLWQDAVARDLDGPAYLVQEGDSWRPVSWTEAAQAVDEIAHGLLALGVRKGDAFAILASTQLEWVLFDFALGLIGAVGAPIYMNNSPKDARYVAKHSEAVGVLCENEEQRAKLDGLQLEHVLTFADLPALRERGRAHAIDHPSAVEDAAAAIDENDLFTFIYTSGTTGPPKGVLQTHGNHLATVESLMKIGFAGEGEVDFFFLPLAHSFARLIEYVDIAAGTITAFARSIDTLGEDMAASRPHFVPAVPRIYEKLYARMQAARESSGAVKRALFDWAVGVGRTRTTYQQEGRAVPALVQWQHALAHRLVFSRIHQLLGGNIRYMTSGGAPLSREIAEFFHAVGLPILEGYGLTETTPSLTVNRPDRFKLGTVGLPLDCCEIRIAPDGEILARGANIALGYHRRPEATAESWDSEGWFHTGDIGEFDEQGFLRITDRKKDLMKTSGGKYVAPQKIENLLKLQPHVSQAVVIGDNRKYCTALITLDEEDVARWASAQGLAFASPEEMAAHPKVRELLESEVAQVNKELASYESIKYFRILPRDLSTETGELTPSLKVKRKVMAERYRQQIDEMYAG
jgi:long-chain acyl-CoA synthetase